MTSLVQPVADVMAREPTTPADHQMGLDNIFKNGNGDIDDGPEQEDRVQQGPECRAVLFLNRVEPVAIKEGEPYGNTDLPLIDENERDNDGAGQRLLGECDRRKGPDFDGCHIVAIKKAIGNAHDFGDAGDEGNGIDDDAENADRDRQALRRDEIGECSGPERIGIEHIDRAKDDEFSAEDGSKNHQEARHSCRKPGGDCECDADTREPDGLGVTGRKAEDKKKSRGKTDENGQIFHSRVSFAISGQDKSGFRSASGFEIFQAFGEFAKRLDGDIGESQPHMLFLSCAEIGAG